MKCKPGYKLHLNIKLVLCTLFLSFSNSLKK